MALSEYDKMFLNGDQQNKISQLTDEWNRANAAGDRARMDSAHAAAETIRNSAYYTGGGDGSQYAALPYSEKYNASNLPSYRAQKDAVNSAYDTATQAQLAALKGAYDNNLSTLENQIPQIQATYQDQKNAVGAQSEMQKAAFNEYAAASGLNSGAGGQAELSRQNTLQGNLATLGKAQAQAETDTNNRIAQLKTQYQNDVASAIAQGEYSKAAALLDEYRTAEQSMVNVAQAQANENYRAYGAAYGQRQDDLANQQQRAAMLAQYGDFSTYGQLGYTPDQIASMEQIWLMQNPLLAYNMGKISQADYYKYAGITGGGYDGYNPGSNPGAAPNANPDAVPTNTPTEEERSKATNDYRSVINTIKGPVDNLWTPDQYIRAAGSLNGYKDYLNTAMLAATVG